MISPPPVVSPGPDDLAKLPKLKRKLAAEPRPTLPRPPVPIRVKLQVALMQLNQIFGMPVQLDHDPALENRVYNPETGRYTPDANDANYLVWRPKDAHDKKTHGPGGTKRITTKGSDNHTREHREAVSASEQKWRDKMAAAGKPVVPRRT